MSIGFKISEKTLFLRVQDTELKRSLIIAHLNGPHVTVVLDTGQILCVMDKRTPIHSYSCHD